MDSHNPEPLILISIAGTFNILNKDKKL